jgi:hypothetical protein
MFILSSDNFYRPIKSAVLKSNTPVLEKSGEEIKSKSVELITTTS